MSSKSLWRVAGCLQVCWLLSAVAAYSDDSSVGVDAYIRKEMEARHIPGVAVAVMKNGQVWLAKGYGLANVELQVPVTEDTVYQLASVTKQFTATAIMQLIQDAWFTPQMREFLFPDRIKEGQANAGLTWPAEELRAFVREALERDSAAGLQGSLRRLPAAV